MMMVCSSFLRVNNNYSHLSAMWLIDVHYDCCPSFRHNLPPPGMLSGARMRRNFSHLFLFLLISNIENLDWNK